MGAQGTTTINFGAFPGSSDASVTITGQTGILSNSLVEAWLMPSATSDHSADEHLLETIKIMAGNIVAGTGFTIYAINTSELFEIDRLPSEKMELAANVATRTARTTFQPRRGGIGTRIYGQWTIAWAWN